MFFTVVGWATTHKFVHSRCCLPTQHEPLLTYKRNGLHQHTTHLPRPTACRTIRLPWPTPQRTTELQRPTADTGGHVKEAANNAPYAGAIYALRIGCVLHTLHVAVTAGLCDEHFMVPMGQGLWHEWPYSHVVALLGTIWYNVG